MTAQELLEAGFKSYPPSIIDTCEELFQLRVRDDVGTRYFVNVQRYDWPDRPEGWEVELCFNDGCKWHRKAAVRVRAYAGVADWTVAELLYWASQVWERIAPRYYERVDCSDE